jgi:voltage-gated potassium channel
VRPQELAFYRRSRPGRLWLHLWGRWRYLVRPLVLVDLLTILALVPMLRGLRALRLLRLVHTARVFRYGNPFHGLARSFEENRLLYALSLSWVGVMVLLGGLSIWLVERDDPEASVQTFADGVWWALVTLTTVGYGDLTTADPVGRVIGGALMVGGMFTLAIFAGVVGQTLLGAVLSIREEQFRMSGYIDHVVVCGYDEGSRMLVDALLAELGDSPSRVVVFAPGERPAGLPVEITWISGDPTKESELDKVRITHARAAIVVGSRSVNPQHADATSILTVFTIRRVVRHRPDAGRQRPLRVVCEILDAENEEHARTAGADEVIETTRIGFSLMAHAVVQPGTGEILGEVGMVGAQDLFVGRAPEEVALPAPFSAVATAVHAARGCLVIGVRPQRGADVVNPPADRVVQPGDRLLYLAPDARLSAR